MTGTVLILDEEAGTATIDVGAVGCDGKPVLLVDVPYNKVNPPKPGEIVTITKGMDAP